MSSSPPADVRVLRLRVKDKHAVWLRGLAREVNTVFNYPTLAECYKVAAFDGINRLGIFEEERTEIP